VRYELMIPDEVIAARQQKDVAYVPVGPLEWHGPHLPLGLDGLHAQGVALRAAEETGGVVLPTLFAGSETVRLPGPGPQSLSSLGFSGSERIVGMDFPGNSVSSTYFEESAFGVCVREIVQNLISAGYELIVLVNGHGAPNHQRTLRRIATETDGLRSSRVIYHLAFLPKPDEGGPSHAAREETAIALALFPSSVRCDLLPPDGVPLKYTEHGIVDAKAFDGHPAPGYALPEADHPRRATAEEGSAILSAEGKALAQRVRDLLHA
jgi:creatinine amidohydrolase